MSHQLSEMKTDADSSPLKGLKVIDLSGLLPGAFATAILADLGAQVTRIEAPRRPDLTRHLPPMSGDQSAAHLSLNRGKRSVALNLKHPKGVALARQLIEGADVLVEQFRPGVMDRLGLGYEALSTLNPRLIYCSITGYGQTGPLSHRAGHDINYLALSGLASYGGSPAGPSLSATQVADIAGGSQPAVIAILAALLGRAQHGRGRHLDISISDGALALNALTLSGAQLTGVAPTPRGELLNGGTLYDYYETADGRHLAIGALEPQFATRLLTRLGHPEWLGELLKPPAEQAELKRSLQAMFKREPLSHWLALFEGEDCCVDPVLSLTEAVEHPHYQARGLFTHYPTQGGPMAVMHAPLGFPQPEIDVAQSTGLGPELNAQGAELLRALGVDERELEVLRAEGVTL